MTQPTQCVLLVDDHPLQLQLLQEALSPEFAVRMAQSGEAALREVATQAPDLILLDVLMPDMDGFEVCRRLRAHAHWKDIPVIFVTSMDEATSESEGLALGAADYIVKPFHVVTVRQRVRNLLERERLRQTVERQRDLLQAQMQERARAADRLRLAASVFTHAREGITIAGLDGLIVDVNDAFTRITGYSREEVVGRNPNILSSGRQTKAFYTAMWASLKRNGTWTGEIWNRRKNGEVYAEMLTINTVLDAQGQPSQYVAMFSDITATKNYQNQLDHIAHFDALTNLPNRVLLGDRLRQALALTLRRGGLLALAYIDLDGFKAINDAHGHEVGDEVLIDLAKRMKHMLREGDTLARLGGDEFVAVLVDLPDAHAAAPTLSQLLAAAAQPVVSGDLTLRASASVGVTFFPQAEDVDADQLLRQADQAMYQAKIAGKNRYHVFDDVQDRTVRGLHESLDRIRAALAAREFVLHYQPKVNMHTGEVVGAEALIRWQHPQRGLLAPAAFLPVIEDHPLSIEVGEWVLDTALHQLEAWEAAGLCIPVSVNVGALHLQSDDFMTRLQAILARHPRVKPQLLDLELLETSALNDVMRVSAIIGACRQLGVTFSLDDFGTGYSSLTYLKRLPVAQLKIDQSFVRNMLDDPDDLSILEGVIGLASAFNKEVIAEGVEALEHGTLLLQLGCSHAQGYGVARPMPGEAMVDWIHTWQPPAVWRATTVLDRDDRPLLVATVQHRAWMQALTDHLGQLATQPPPLVSTECHLGHWLAVAGQARHGQSASYAQLCEAHERLHALAAQACQLHAKGLAGEAQTQLAQARLVSAEVLAHMQTLLLPAAH